MKCFQYTLNQHNQGPSGILPEGSITGLFHDSKYYGAALIDDLSILSDWNAIEISGIEFNDMFSIPDYDPILTQLEPYIREKYSNIMESIVKPYTIQERETWFIQIEEAFKYKNNNLIDIEEIRLISTVATKRNITLDEFVNTILQKNAEYRLQIGNILGMQQTLINQLWQRSE